MRQSRDNIAAENCKKPVHFKKYSEMNIIDLIKGRKNIIHQESEGINLAIHLINKFQSRTFSFKGLRKKYSRLTGADLLTRIREEMDSMLILYRYTTKIKKYTDRKEITHAEIKLLGKASTMSRYNPLDVELLVKTEIPNK